MVERPLTTEPALLAAHVCKAGALFGVAEGELVSNGAGGASGGGAADPNGQATPGRGVQSLTSLISSLPPGYSIVFDVVEQCRERFLEANKNSALTVTWARQLVDYNVCTTSSNASGERP